MIIRSLRSLLFLSIQLTSTSSNSGKGVIDCGIIYNTKLVAILPVGPFVLTALGNVIASNTKCVLDPTEVKYK